MNWRRDITNQVISHCRSELDLTLHIDVEFSGFKHEFAKAFCGVDGDGDIIIELTSHLTKEQIIEMVCHECVHAMQEQEGDVLDYTLPYYQQQHEIEAYDMQDHLVLSFNMKG